MLGEVSKEAQEKEMGGKSSGRTPLLSLIERTGGYKKLCARSSALVRHLRRETLSVVVYITGEAFEMNGKGEIKRCQQ